jgi:hypothetical protein
MAMKLDGTYAFSELTNVEGIFVSNGQERATGKLIQIHLFPAAKAEQANRICQELIHLPDEVRDKILKYGQEGSASYFVTEPLPPGEYLQSWIERLKARAPSNATPAMSQGITTQLRQMGIAPSPLAPIMPGPDHSPKRSSPVQTTAGILRDPVQSTPATPPGSMTVAFKSLYGERETELELPSVEFQNVARPEAPAAKDAPGLNTFIGLYPGAASAPKDPAREPTMRTVEEPPRSQPVVSFDPLNNFPDHMEPSPQPRVMPVAAPTAVPLPAPKKPQPSQSNLDWKTVSIFAGVLLALVALIIVIVEYSA